MPTLAIGDIHGCHTALAALLKVVNPGANDQLVFLGDYIDRGPASRSVIDLLIQQAKINPCVFLRGNHEEMILDVRNGALDLNLWLRNGGVETLQSYGVHNRNDWLSLIPASHWHFLEKTIPTFETSSNIFVHAFLDPDLDLADQPPFLIYWEFFDLIKPHKSGKKIICGHSTQHSGRIKDLKHAACIDTAPTSGGWLTCFDPESHRYWQANEKAETRTGCLPD